MISLQMHSVRSSRQREEWVWACERINTRRTCSARASVVKYLTLGTKISNVIELYHICPAYTCMHVLGVAGVPGLQLLVYEALSY